MAGAAGIPLIRLVPLKGARAAGEGRLISLAPASARALAVYLRARRLHKLADSEWLWLGTRNRGRLQVTGLRLNGWKSRAMVDPPRRPER
ncbi:MAG TPA: hypothetical protein VHZ03_22780 [Trebonia sp.]|jgi:hypothetical protein|nr:hypothetical protein [Trebonia sp.]